MANKAAKGKRAKTRNTISRKGPRPTITKLLQQIPIGSKVDIKANSWMQGKGMPFRRFHGMTGTVTARQGRSYIVEATNGNQLVELIIGPAHLTLSRGAKQPTQEEADAKEAKAALAQKRKVVRKPIQEEKPRGAIEEIADEAEGEAMA
ncbi:MAG TPA: hypothetical protein HA254_03790 [Candidatus Diapherotrites archaeon]|uniref:Large ribosomal subunit protein eL21 n=1 Tax=Candidatus Iainarchaeum sp. TaxID=3101447 RepID=A0A7J4J131_9ARCH|nr:hypothetical protein [Candidatus Diapherotrites archaeon]